MLVPSAQGRHRGRSGSFRRTHGRARAQSRLGPRHPVATPWLRRAEARGAILVSYGAMRIFSAPALRGVRASAERRRHSKVRLGCWEIASWNLLCPAHGSKLSGPRPLVWPREYNAPFVLFPCNVHVLRRRERRPRGVTRSSRTIAG